MEALREIVKYQIEWLEKLRVFGCPAWRLEQVEAETSAWVWALEQCQRVGQE